MRPVGPFNEEITEWKRVSAGMTGIVGFGTMGGNSRLTSLDLAGFRDAGLGDFIGGLWDYGWIFGG